MMRTRCSAKKKVGTFLAVAAAGLLSIAIAVPAVASSDAVKGIYAFFSNEKYYTKSPIEKNDLTSYAEKTDEMQKNERRYDSHGKHLLRRQPPECNAKINEFARSIAEQYRN